MDFSHTGKMYVNWTCDLTVAMPTSAWMSNENDDHWKCGLIGSTAFALQAQTMTLLVLGSRILIENVYR